MTNKPKLFYISDGTVKHHIEPNAMQEAAIKMGFEFIHIDPTLESIDEAITKYKNSKGIVFIDLHGTMKDGKANISIGENPDNPWLSGPSYKTKNMLIGFKEENIDISCFSASCFQGQYLHYVMQEFGDRRHVATSSPFEPGMVDVQIKIMQDMINNPNSYKSLTDPESPNYLDAGFIIEKNVSMFTWQNAPTISGIKPDSLTPKTNIFFNYEKALSEFIDLPQEEKKRLLENPKFSKLLESEEYQDVARKLIESEGMADFISFDIRGIALEISSTIMHETYGPYNENIYTREKTIELYEYIHKNKDGDIDLEEVRELISEGADVRNYSGEFLSLALQNIIQLEDYSFVSNLELVKVLLEEGKANPNSVWVQILDGTNIENQIPTSDALSSTYKKSRKELVDLFIENGAVFDLENKEIRDEVENYLSFLKKQENYTNQDILNFVEEVINSQLVDDGFIDDREKALIQEAMKHMNIDITFENSARIDEDITKIKIPTYSSNSKELELSLKTPFH